jgi:uncharacterized membrane protein YgaE (UPF0421/DUF939 family)
MQEAKPLDQSETFSPPPVVEEQKEEEKKSKTFQEIENKWKDEYSRIGDLELERIVSRADSMVDTYEFSDKVRKYTPIKNKKWREMTAKRRQWQTIQSKEGNTDSKSLENLENMIGEYYAEMCNIYFGMTREEYDELPPSETQQAVEVGNHKTMHPLGARKP